MSSNTVPLSCASSTGAATTNGIQHSLAPHIKLGGVPAGVNMPKKRDPRFRAVQSPPQHQFFDSADYEVRKQRGETGRKPAGDSDCSSH